jgi:hypothetical protein
LGSEPLILSNCCFKKKEEKSILLGKRGESKKNVTIARFHLFFTWTFQKRGSIAPGHVSTLFFPANETLRGIEYAQLKKEP